MPKGIRDVTATERVLRVVREYIDQNGYAPSIRDVVELAGLSSTSLADYHLRKLEREGRLKRGPWKTSRSLRVVAD